MASTILHMLLARVDDIACVVVVANAVMDGWGLVPCFLLFMVDRSLLLAWCQWCGLVGLRPTSSRRRAFGLLHRGMLKEGA
jgi:hypothetical protein